MTTCRFHSCRFLALRFLSLIVIFAALGFAGIRLAAALPTTNDDAGITTPGSTAYPPHKPAAGSQIDWNQPLSTGLVTAIPLNDGAGATFYDAVNQQSYHSQNLTGTPAGAQPPVWLTPPLTQDYPWPGPAISNNGATAQAIQSTLQWQEVINNVSGGYSYATLVQPLDTTTFGRILDATGSAVVTLYLNIPGRPGLVSTTWRDAIDGAINPTAPFTLNKWILVLCTVQQGLGVMYINGVQVASSNQVDLANSWANQTGLLVYNTTGNGAQMANANFSSWWVWNNRVLTAPEAAQMYQNPWAMFNSGQKGMIKGTKVTLSNPLDVSNVCLYSHAAAGNLRLGIYDNASPRNLLWQSGSLANTAANAWLRTPITSGSPANLTLGAGVYWLAWQTDTTLAVPSYTAGTNGDGFVANQPYASFPAALNGEQTTAERWSIYLESPGIVTTLPARVTSVWGGARACIALLSDGTVWDWGFNWYGKLGDNTTSIFSPPDNSNDRHTPIEVHGPGNVGYLNSIKAIMGGESHNFALKTDGTVWAWGWNGFGQLGDGTTSDSYTPVQVSGLNSVIALGGRGYHSLAIRSDGTVWDWGFNASGQLGDGTTTNSNLPVQVSGLSQVLAVTGGYNFSVALKSDHTLCAWGSNASGQLGNGSNTSSDAPVPVSDLSNVKQVSCGWKHAVAVKSDGTVWTWGGNFNGELGDGTTANSNVPLQVSGLSNMIAVSGGDDHTAALKADGTVWTWGANDKGQLGDGTYVEKHAPVQVVGLTQMTAVAARDYHNIAIKSDGSVWTWGWNVNGQLGDDTTTTRTTPVKVITMPQSGVKDFDRWR